MYCSDKLFRLDITIMVDWALKINCLSIYPVPIKFFEIRKNYHSLLTVRENKHFRRLNGSFLMQHKTFHLQQLALPSRNLQLLAVLMH